MNHFKAPWGTKLRGTSALTTILLLGVDVYYLAHAAPQEPRWVAVLPVVFLLVPVLFMVRGYTITGDAILVERLGWATRLPLARLESAVFQPDAMRNSRRKFGNGGLFSFTGWYWNQSLGAYRAYVTDMNRTVVLTFPSRRIVVSPDEPEEFVRVLTSLHGCPA